MKKILRYLSGTQKFGINLAKTSEFKYTGFCDALGEILLTEKVRMVFSFIQVTLLVAWQSKKQDTVARSSTEV